MSRTIFFTIVIAVGSACAAPNGGSVGSRKPTDETELLEAKVNSTVDSLVTGFWAAWAAADVDAGIGFFSEDATAITKTGTILRGRERIDAAWRPGFATISGQVIEFSESFISVYAPDLASVHQVGSFLVDFTDGTSDGPLPFTYTTVWKRIGGDWKIIVAQRTDPPRPAG